MADKPASASALENAPTSTNEGTQLMEWDEAKIRSSLAKIEQLQDQIDALRSVIPSVTTAAATRNPSKNAYFANFQKVAVSGSQQVNDFREAWLSEDTQQILEQARKSRDKDQDMSKAVNVPKYGWVESQNDEV